MPNPAAVTGARKRIGQREVVELTSSSHDITYLARSGQVSPFRSSEIVDAVTEPTTGWRHRVSPHLVATPAVIAMASFRQSASDQIFAIRDFPGHSRSAN